MKAPTFVPGGTGFDLSDEIRQQQATALHRYLASIRNEAQPSGDSGRRHTRVEKAPAAEQEAKFTAALRRAEKRQQEKHIGHESPIDPTIEVEQFPLAMAWRTGAGHGRCGNAQPRHVTNEGIRDAQSQCCG